MVTLESPLLGIFAGGDATSRDFHTVPLTRRERDVPCLIIMDTQFSFAIYFTCRRGNSSFCPTRSRNPASSLNTVPALTLEGCQLSIHLSFLPVEVPVNDHLQSLVCTRLCILDLWEIPSFCLKGLRTIIQISLNTCISFTSLL